MHKEVKMTYLCIFPISNLYSKFPFCGWQNDNSSFYWINYFFLKTPTFSYYWVVSFNKKVTCTLNIVPSHYLSNTIKRSKPPFMLNST